MEVNYQRIAYQEWKKAFWNEGSDIVGGYWTAGMEPTPEAIAIYAASLALRDGLVHAAGSVSRAIVEDSRKK